MEKKRTAGSAHQPPLAPAEVFRGRLVRHSVAGLGVLALSLLIGVGGYHWVAKLGWLDALLNASMILSGMGPVDPLATPAAKLFASFYALFSGVVFLGVASIVFAPVVHRMLHRFHIDDSDS